MSSKEQPPSSPQSAATNGVESLSYYKAQYEQLEADLAEFQTSSKELESELERDVEASEKRERQLQEKVESLGYEVEEWKVGDVFCELIRQLWRARKLMLPSILD